LDLLPNIDINKNISDFERRFLEKFIPGPLSLSKEFDGLEFVKINGITRFWQDDNKTDDLLERFIDIVTGAAVFQKYIAFVIIGKKQKVEIFYSFDDVNNCSSLFHGIFPGIVLDEDQSSKKISKFTDLGSQIQGWAKYSGVVSGIPSSISKNKDRQFPGFYDSIIRSMRSENWFIAIKSYPYNNNKIETERDSLLEQIALISSSIKGTYQQSNQINSPVSNRVSQVQTQSFSGELLNKKAQYLVEILEHNAKRYAKMSKTGQWLTFVSFGSDKSNTSRRLSAIIKGNVSGDESFPDLIRTHICSPSSNTSPVSEFSTFLSSEELALWMCPIQSEVVGFEVHDQIKLDLNSTSKPKNAIGLGEIIWDNFPTGFKYEFDINDFTRHGVVFGITGSGKTTSVMQIISNCWLQSGISFCVIEPAKTEYRGLLGRIINNKPTGLIPELRIITIGNEQVAPFRINPFEFELTDDPNKSLLLPHIDFLKAVFNAAFILYAPMPYILEISLYEIYEDKGWNLASGKNSRLPVNLWKDRDKFPIFPTLSDLYKKIEEVTLRAGYGSQIEKDVIASLKVRINGLRVGSKGLMMDVARGNSMNELLKFPTILELEAIGNDDEKSFLMGLILARIYEYRRLNSHTQNDLSHLLIVEEAHRLLKKVNTQVSSEESNLRANAIETFSNMLSEIRHYGQGVLVSEQIPSKLSEDVIRNTNLKIIHRLLAKDDRDLVATTMNMDEKQSKVFSVLKRGEAVIYSENDDHPCHIKMENFKNQSLFFPLTDKDIFQIAHKYINLSPFQSVDDFGDYGINLDCFGNIDQILSRRANQLLDQSNNSLIWGMIILRILYSKSTLGKLVNYIEQQYISLFGQKEVAETIEGLKIFFILGAQKIISNHSSERNLDFSKEIELRKLLSGIMTSLSSPVTRNSSNLNIDGFRKLYLEEFKLPNGPYAGCKFCKNKCHFLVAVKNCLSQTDISYFQEILENDDQKTFYSKIKSLTLGLAQEWLDSENAEIKNIGFCAALTLAASQKLDMFAQEEYSKNLSSVFFDISMK